MRRVLLILSFSLMLAPTAHAGLTDVLNGARLNDTVSALRDRLADLRRRQIEARALLAAAFVSR